MTTVPGPAPSAVPATPAARRVPPLGGLNATLARIELKRMLRNRRTIVFALVFPAAMFFVFFTFGNENGGRRSWRWRS